MGELLSEHEAGRSAPRMDAPLGAAIWNDGVVDETYAKALMTAFLLLVSALIVLVTGPRSSVHSL